MTALHEAIEYSALGWVKPELDETLRMVGVEVEGFAEDPADNGRMRVCADLLHQVQGTLRMVELYAPAMVAEEMEQVSVALRNAAVPDRDVACSALLRGVVLLPDYLERLQSGHKEISIVLLPLLNELRAARGEAGLSESALFVPDLDRVLPTSLPRASAQSPAARANEVAPFLARLRDALQAWPEHGAPGDAAGLHFAAEALLSRTVDESQRRMLWVASMVAGALRDGAMQASAGLRQAFASVDRETRGLFDQGVFDTPRADAALEPTRQLLYHVAHSDSGHPALVKLREVFDLDALRPTESELDHARGSVAGRNRLLLDTVSAAVKEELLRVKDELDLYLRTGRSDAAMLQPQAEALQRVSDTLGMLGLGLARTLVQKQRDAMQEIVDGTRQADETALLDIAGALLYVDASLDDQVARLASGDGADTEEDLAGAEARKVLDVLVREAITNFAGARQAFDAFVETAWNHAELAQVPRLLGEVSGALNILELPQPAQYLDGVRLYTEVELLERRRIPNGRQLDTFADALASVEYYLEALRDRRATRDDILDITRNSLEALGYWPLPVARLQAPAAIAPGGAGTAALSPVAQPPADAPVPQDIATIIAARQAVAEAAAPAVSEAPVPRVDAFTDDASVSDAPGGDLPAGEATVADATAADRPAFAAPTVEDPIAEVPADEGPGVQIQDARPHAADAPEAGSGPRVPDESPAPDVGIAPVVVAAPPPFVPLFVPPPAAPPVAVPAVSPPAMPAVLSAGFDATSDDIDDEIREIFLEEFEEEIGNLGQLLPAWKSDPNNIERLQPVRRVFHTLKGSGRLVGAKTLGEFSWKIENMLNKVRDGLRPATAPVIAMVDQACATLPQLHAALRGDGVVTADLRAMEAFADRIAGGEEVMPVLGAAAAAPQAPPLVAFEPVATEFTAGAALPEEGDAPVSVDAVLFEILQAEVAGHLATIDGWLARARTAATSADEPLVRAIHTMNGAFAMTEVPSITDVLTPAEGYVRRLLASAGQADDEGVLAIAGLADSVRATVDALSVAGGRVPRCDALAARFVALRDDLPESRPVSLIEEPSHEQVPDRIELTELDLSAYGRFDAALPAQPDGAEDGAAERVEDREAGTARLDAVAPDGVRFDDLRIDGLDLDAEAEAQLARLLENEDTASPAEPAEPVAEDPTRLLALMESLEAERADAERIEAERAEAERVEAERAEAERAEAERAEAERIEAERVEAERTEAERVEAERVEAERVEAERIEAERIEVERAEAERIDAERVEAERAEAERIEAERIEAERIEAERIEAERIEAERAEAERAEAQRLADLREQEHRDMMRLEMERLESERLEAERLEGERVQAERAEAERAADADTDAQRFEAALLDAERLLAEAAVAGGADPDAEDVESADDVPTRADAQAESPVETDAGPAQEPDDAVQADTDTDGDADALAEAEPERAIDTADEPRSDTADIDAGAAAREAALPAAFATVVDPDGALDMGDLDADLIDIFVEEGHDLLDHSDQLLVALRGNPDEREVIAGLQRDLHTLKGGARMAGVMAIGELGHAMESLLEAAAEHRMQLGRQDVPLLERGFDRLHTMVTRVGERRAVAMPDALIAAFDARAVGAPYALAVGVVDPAGTGVIAIDEEAAQASAEATVDELAQQADEAPIGEVALDAPTLEGTPFEAIPLDDIALDAAELDAIVLEGEAVLAEADASAADAHALAEAARDAADIETIQDEAAEDGAEAVELDAIDGHALDSAALASDALDSDDAGRDAPASDTDEAGGIVEADHLDHALADHKIGDGLALDPGFLDESRLDDMLAAGRGADETPPATVDSATVEDWRDVAPRDADAAPAPEAPAIAAAARTFAPLAALKPLSAPMAFGLGADEDASLRGSQEQVRVRAELLDRLVNYAGEVAIYRSRLEQQLGAFRGATSEMEQTTMRLRDQLRRLEIETEAQIIARYQREGETRDATFDPLELDRFSNLQQLSRALSETAADLGSLHTTLDDLTQQYDTLLLQQSRVSSELQEGLMRTRMVPFDTVVPRLRRVLRQASTDTGKQVQLRLDGAQGELDRNVLERMTAPLEHMLRNAVAHGIEMPAQRGESGKSEEGSVLISVRKEGSEVVLQIADDGAGLDRRAIRQRGESRGLVRAESVLSNAQLDALILEPGFSTAEEVSRLAGRGVGMDVVASEIRQLGGTLDIHSERGAGTTFTLRLPQTLAVTQAAFVRIGETTFAVPIASVRGVGRIPREELASGELTSYRYGNEEYVLHDLGKLLGHAPAKAEGQLQMPLLLTRSGDLHIAVTVDQIVGNREIVVKPIGPQVASIPGIFGATIMGDGSVVVILDVAPLVRRQAALLPEVVEETPQPASEQRVVPLVMVVDDSITMRKVTGRVLERNNFEVITAKDGIDALERMVDRVPDLMLLDIEMPRMDGYELATAMKADPRLADVPIIMITSRTGDKHRQRAMDIGVDRYLGKPYQENELMRNVFALLDESQPRATGSDA